MSNIIKEQSARAGISVDFMTEIISHSGASAEAVADACGFFSDPATDFFRLKFRMIALSNAEVVSQCVNIMGSSGQSIASWILSDK